MKNLFFALAFMFIGSFTFANNNTTNEVLEPVTIEAVTETVSEVSAADILIVITDYYLDGEYIGSTIDIYVY